MTAITAIWAGRPGVPDDAARNHLLRARAGLLPYGADASVLLPDAKFTGKSAEIGRTRGIFRGLRAKTFRRGHSWNLCKFREYSTAYVRPAGDETRFRSSEFRATPFVQFMEPVNLTAPRITIVHACATRTSRSVHIGTAATASGPIPFAYPHGVVLLAINCISMPVP